MRFYLISILIGFQNEGNTKIEQELLQSILANQENVIISSTIDYNSRTRSVKSNLICVHCSRIELIKHTIPLNSRSY